MISNYNYEMYHFCIKLFCRYCSVRGAVGAALYGVHVADRTPGRLTFENSSTAGVLMDDVKNDSALMTLSDLVLRRATETSE